MLVCKSKISWQHEHVMANTFSFSPTHSTHSEARIRDG